MMEHNVISVSGGKDSTALLLLAIERQTENMQVVFADTGNEHPQTYEYVQYLEKATGIPIRWVKEDFSERIAQRRKYIIEKWPSEGESQEKIDEVLSVLHPTGIPFLDLCLWKGRFPSSQAQFCTSFLKVEPIVNQVLKPLLSEGHDVYSWQGVRADESERRSKLKELEFSMAVPDGGELWNYRPILGWTAEKCFAIHKKHGIKPNPLYMQDMGRVGCMPCVNCQKKELLAISTRFPFVIDRIEDWELIVGAAGKRSVEGQTFFPARGETNESAYRAGNIRQRVEWSKTARGGRQYNLIESINIDEPSACSSRYGLCE